MKNFNFKIISSLSGLFCVIFLLIFCIHQILLFYFSVLSSFCEAIVDYIANIEKAPDPNVTKEFFATEVFAAWDIFFNIWLNSKEAKVLKVQYLNLDFI